MACRLQVVIPEDLAARLRVAAQRSRTSTDEWVRRAIEDALRQTCESPATGDSLSRLASLEGPTGDIDQMLADVEAGRGAG